MKTNIKKLITLLLSACMAYAASWSGISFFAIWLISYLAVTVEPSRSSGAKSATVGRGRVRASSVEDDLNWRYESDAPTQYINPTTGLPMIGNSIAGVDVGGHCYGEVSPDWGASSDVYSGGF